jgi:hypothetical protein
MDPLRTLLNLTDGKRQYVIDSDHVTQEEFEAAACMADVLWGHQGLAEMLGSTWRMVHDPRFLAVERCGIYEQRNMFSPDGTQIGVQTVRSSDLFSQSGSIDDMTIYAELLGEGRHLKKVVEAKGWDPSLALSEDQVWQLIRQECPNYQRRDGSWNRAATVLHELLVAGLVSLVTDYAELAYCTDWINVDTQEVVEPGKRLMIREDDGFEAEDETPVMAAEVDSLYKALTLRAQVRMTAYKLLKQFPGLKGKELEDLAFTDLESDRICQILFTTPFDKLYTAMPPIVGIVQTAKSRSYAERMSEETAQLRTESQEFNAKLKSGEIAQIVTPIEEAPDDDPSVFFAQLTQNPYYAGLFQALQKLEAKGSTEATALAEELLACKGTGDVWGRISKLVTNSNDDYVDHGDLQKLAEVHGVEWKETSAAQSMVLGDNVHASTTELDEVFDGQASQVFDFVYLNPHINARGHRTAVVDVRKEDGLARRTWSISAEHYRQLQDAAEGLEIETLKWRRDIDHSTGTTKFHLVL